jgi:hypothetical protein
LVQAGVRMGLVFGPEELVGIPGAFGEKVKKEME